MSEAAHLSDALEGLFTNPEAGWFTPLVEAVKDLTAAQASQVPAEGFNCVWGVINHICYWQEFVLRRLRGESVDDLRQESENGWPAVGNPGDEEAWQSAQARAQAVNHELAEFVVALEDASLAEPYAEGRPKRYQLLHGLIGHNSYHTCEVISIRHMLGFWLENV